METKILNGFSATKKFTKVIIIVFLFDAMFTAALAKGSSSSSAAAASAANAHRHSGASSVSTLTWKPKFGLQLHTIIFNIFIILFLA
ncbi:unnamed protein product [Cuscuta epithymum]|uniref:Uncharacterized protein n=1 Tax=Cuscuta epithymum TaxID=186058 RepID=A0AAV0DDQ7_9ASTE|nr:unnamed protein product [Cuscuta epithymum]CAH9135449.1 unnamed protein product [Cuscuta epithymum]